MPILRRTAPPWNASEVGYEYDVYIPLTNLFTLRDDIAVPVSSTRAVIEIDAGEVPLQFILDGSELSVDSSGNFSSGTITRVSSEYQAFELTGISVSADAYQDDHAWPGEVGTLLGQGFTYIGTTGRDRLDGWYGNDTLLGGKNRDVLYGEGGDDLLIGGSGSDTINGGAGVDTMLGGSGDDLLRNGVNNSGGVDGPGDVMYGHDGDDTMEGIYSTSLGEILSHEKFFGGAGNDVVEAHHGNDVIHGNQDNDSLNAGAGRDTVYGGTGDDTIFGGEGPDRLLGGAGRDVIAGDYVSLPSGTVYDVDSSGADYIDGGSNHDTIYGGAGKDTILGGSGYDSLFGGVGDDLVFGGQGDDTIYGEQGDNTLEGGAGADTFVLFWLRYGVDEITDFTSGEDMINTVQVIDKMAVHANPLVYGETATGSAAGQFLYDDVTGELWWDFDGTGAASPDLIARLGAGTVLVESDLIY